MCESNLLLQPLYYYYYNSCYYFSNCYCCTATTAKIPAITSRLLLFIHATSSTATSNTTAFIATPATSFFRHTTFMLPLLLQSPLLLVHWYYLYYQYNCYYYSHCYYLYCYYSYSYYNHHYYYNYYYNHYNQLQVTILSMQCMQIMVWLTLKTIWSRTGAEINFLLCIVLLLAANMSSESIYKCLGSAWQKFLAIKHKKKRIFYKMETIATVPCLLHISNLLYSRHLCHYVSTLRYNIYSKTKATLTRSALPFVRN